MYTCKYWVMATHPLQAMYNCLSETQTWCLPQVKVTATESAHTNHMIAHSNTLIGTLFKLMYRLKSETAAQQASNSSSSTQDLHKRFADLVGQLCVHEQAMKH